MRAWIGAAIGVIIAVGCSDTQPAAPHTPTPTAIQESAPVIPPLPPPDTLVEPWVEPFFPDLKGEPGTDSISVGHITTGTLIRGRALAFPSLNYAVLPRQSKRATHHGTDEMIGLLERVAAKVRTETGRRLWLGNISKQGGGDLHQSVSHNSGRDADIAFCYLNTRDKPVERLPDLIPVGKKGISKWKGGHRFDAACTWEIIKALVSDEDADIQYLFIAAWLKKRILKHARSQKEDPKLILRADALMFQPGKTSPHDDHIHVRLHCAKDDIARGCVEQGRAAPWHEDHTDLRPKAIETLTANLATADPEERARTIERLALLQATDAAETLTPLLEDDSERVRRAVTKALAELGTQTQAEALAARFDKEPLLDLKVDILQATAKLGGDSAGTLLATIIADPESEKIALGPLPDAILTTYTLPPPTDPRFPDQDLKKRQKTHPMGPVAIPRYMGRTLDLSPLTHSLRLAAIEAAADCACKAPVPALIALLDHPQPAFRGRVIRALRRLTNGSGRIGWDNPDLSDRKRDKGKAYWAAWWDKHQKKTRDDWLAAGFSERGYKVPQLSRRHCWGLVRAISGPDHLSYNAQRTLMDLTRHRPMSLTWNKNAAGRHWARWLDRRRGDLGIRKMPKSLQKIYK